MEKSLAFADYAVIAFFFAVMIGVGTYYSRKSKSSDQFFGNDMFLFFILTKIC